MNKVEQAGDKTEKTGLFRELRLWAWGAWFFWAVECLLMYFQVAFYQGKWSFIKGRSFLEAIPHRFEPADALEALLIDAAVMALLCAGSIILLRIVRKILKRYEISATPFHGAVYLGIILFLYGAVIVNIVLLPGRFGTQGKIYTALLAVTVLLIWLLIYRHLNRRHALGDGWFAFWSLACVLMVCLFGIWPWLDYHSNLVWKIPKGYTARIGILVGVIAFQQVVLHIRAWVASRRGGEKTPGGLRLWAARILAFATIVAAVAFTLAFRTDVKLDPDLVTRSDSKLPNILMISMDTVRADALSCYSDKGKTPFLDKLAARSVLFEDARSPSPWTLPGHASMFTARYPSAHGASWEFTYLPDSETTLAEILATAGYKTAAFSSNVWVSHFTNITQGFDYFYILGNKFQLNRKARERPLLLWEAMARPILTRLNNRGWLDSVVNFRIKNKSRQINGMIKRYLKRNEGSEQPFFIFVNYIDSHNPYKPLGKLRPKPPEGVNMKKIRSVNNKPPKIMAERIFLTEEEKEYWISLYYLTVTSLDVYINELFQVLEKAGFMEDVVVIVTSDHGEYLGEYDQYCHLFGVHEPVIRVPFILYSPDRIEGGKRFRSMVQTVDIPPTLLELAGIKFRNSSRFQGKSLMPLVKDNAHLRNYSVSELMVPTLPLEVFRRLKGPSGKYNKWNTRQRSITDKSYQLEVHQNGYRQLWKLPEDISSVEGTEVPGNPEPADKMEGELKGWLKSFEHADTSKMERPEMSEDFKKQLKALGYLK